MDYISLAMSSGIIACICFMASYSITAGTAQNRRITALRDALDRIVALGTDSVSPTAQHAATLAEDALLADDKVLP